MTSFYAQFSVVLEKVDENSCNGGCTHDVNQGGDITDYEST